jgi:para-aminobenzoate synthetase/4-amino-4-deoxychorismate lyase
VLDPQILARPGTVLLDTARPDAANRRSWCFDAPRRVLTASTSAELSALLSEATALTADGAYVAGYVSYEAGAAFVDLPMETTADEPLAWFGVYEAPQPVAPSEVATGLSRLDGEAVVTDVEFGVSQAEYTSAIDRVRHHIGEGDVYQINYTAPVDFRLEGDPRVLYRRLRQRQHVPYGAYLNLGDRQILSCSPELFFRRENERVVTRPMKGTIRRGRTQSEDQELQAQLAADPKNRAENLMIVDLLRNDLSVCCEPGSVTVPSLYTTASYDTVTQMTSTVEGTLRSDQDVASVLRALFPCGSVTGAPKRRAMRLIRSLEAEPRGVYCGAIGMIGPDTATFNVAIRTAVLNGDEGRMGVGSGVVWDSEPEAEYEECTLKTQFLTPSTASAQIADPDHDPRLIETMRFDGIQIPMLDRHVERLAASAEHFGYCFDEERVRRHVDRATTGTEPGVLLKVRATLDRWGRVSVSTAPLPEERDEPWTLAVADQRVDRTDPFFYHKTTHRQVYDRALAAAREKGADEAVLLNQDGEVTEGTYSNLFVQKGDRLLTPPVESGLLAGVYRDYVLEAQPQAEEEVLTLDDLRDADAIFCCNGLRGWCPAKLEAVPVPAE